MKKAQANQIFTWLIAIVMLSLVVLFGYRAITNIQGRGAQARFLEFKTDLTSAIESNSGYMDAANVGIRVPSIYEYVCFVNTHNSFPALTAIDDPIIKDSVDSQKANQLKEENVFLVKDIAEKGFWAGDIEVTSNNGYLCVEVVGGEIDLALEGFGKYTRVSES